MRDTEAWYANYSQHLTLHCLVRFKYIFVTSYLPSCVKYLTKSLLCKNFQSKTLITTGSVSNIAYFAELQTKYETLPNFL